MMRLPRTSPPHMHHLERIDRPWRQMPPPAREAILDLIAEPYVRLAYPKEADFAAAFGVEPGTMAYREAWADQVAERKAIHRNAYGDDDRVYALCARGRDGALVALATMLTARGTRSTPLADAIGDPRSSLPTLRLLHFTCGLESGLSATTTPEHALAEFARICVRQRQELLALVSVGRLTHAEAAYVEERGFDEVFALSYWRDRALPDPPRAYLGNAQPRMSGALARRGLDVRPLHLAAGASPSARVLGAGGSTGAYFGKWPRVLEPHVPAAVLDRGVAAAILYLVESGFDGWDSLELSLPFLILNNARTAEAMATIANACALPDDPTLPSPCAVPGE